MFLGWALVLFGIIGLIASVIIGMRFIFTDKRINSVLDSKSSRLSNEKTKAASNITRRVMKKRLEETEILSVESKECPETELMEER